MFSILGLMKNSFLAFAPDSALLGPPKGNVVVVDSDGVLIGHGFAAVMDGIRFNKSVSGFIPLIGFDGDLFA